MTSYYDPDTALYIAATNWNLFACKKDGNHGPLSDNPCGSGNSILGGKNVCGSWSSFSMEATDMPAHEYLLLEVELYSIGKDEGVFTIV